MKKYIFLFNTKIDIVVSAKNSGSELNIKYFNLIVNLVRSCINLTGNKYLYKIDNKDLYPLLKTLQIELLSALNRRNCVEPSSEKTDWKYRFTEEQMFQNKNIFGVEYKLFKGGIDNEILSLFSFYELVESCINDGLNIYVFFNDKIIDIKRVQRILYILENKKSEK